MQYFGDCCWHLINSILTHKTASPAFDCFTHRTNGKAGTVICWLPIEILADFEQSLYLCITYTSSVEDNNIAYMRGVSMRRVMIIYGLDW